MKRRIALAIARAEKRARYKGGHQVKSKYGLKRQSLFETMPFPYTEDNCPAHVASIKPHICARCGAKLVSFDLESDAFDYADLIPPIPEF